MKRYEDLGINKIEFDCSKEKIVLEFEKTKAFNFFIDFMNEEL